MIPVNAKSSSLLMLAFALGITTAPAQNDPTTEPAVLAVSKAMPAVVNINTERIVKRTYEDPYDAVFRQFFGGPMRPPRELRQKVQSLGSGFIIDPAGYIVTNEHVVERAADLRIQVTTTDGKTYTARYVSGDPSSDIAFIKIESDKAFPFIELKNPSPNLLGQTVLALGNPLGYGSSVSRGILSAVNRTISIDDQEFKDLVQTDAAINPGNSGGPLIDLQGRLVGVNSVKMAYTPQGVPTQGLGFAVPATIVRDRVAMFMQDLKNPAAKKRTAADHGSKAMQMFGLQLQDMSDELSDAFGYQNAKGALIADVAARSPAEAAGLRRGEVVYKIGRYDIGGTREVETLLASARSGTIADFVVGTVRQVRGQYVQQLRTVAVTAR